MPKATSAQIKEFIARMTKAGVKVCPGLLEVCLGIPQEEGKKLLASW
jgi:hypothetical protein